MVKRLINFKMIDSWKLRIDDEKEGIITDIAKRYVKVKI